VDWDLHPTETTGARLEPYPFVATRWRSAFWRGEFQKRRYADDLDLQKVLAQAPYFGQKLHYVPETHG